MRRLYGLSWKRSQNTKTDTDTKDTEARKSLKISIRKGKPGLVLNWRHISNLISALISMWSRSHSAEGQYRHRAYHTQRRKQWGFVSAYQPEAGRRVTLVYTELISGCACNNWPSECLDRKMSLMYSVFREWTGNRTSHHWT